MGQGDGFRAQHGNFRILHPVRVGKEARHNGGRDGSRGIVLVIGIFQVTQLVPVQSFDDPGIGAMAPAEFRNPESPAFVISGLVITTLAHGPFLKGQTHIAHIGGHFAQNLTAGQAQKQAVGRKEGNLSVRGYRRIAIDQVITQQTIGTVILLNFRPCSGVHGITHGITHRKAQQTAPVRFPFGNHRNPSFFQNVDSR